MNKDSYARTIARRAAILEIAQTGEVSIADLAERFGVTLSTIRRDVARLAADRRVSRTYGGVTVINAVPELDISRKSQQHPTEKGDIARYASTLVKPGDMVLLDAGTTTGQLATELRSFSDLTVVTGGMNALLALHDAPTIDLIVIGGRLRRVNEGTVGPLAEYGLSHMHADSAFLGAEGLSPEHGIACRSLEQATLKTRMMESARDLYVLVDHSKLERKAFNYWAPLPLRASIITDEGADNGLVAPFAERWNVDVAQVATNGRSLESDIV